MLRTTLVHLRAQWMGALALFLVIAGGTAFAADTIGSSDVIDNSLLSADLKNNQAVRSVDVGSETLTGADIADQSGVDTCVLSVRYGQLCVRVENAVRPWDQAFSHCANLGLRLPSATEAMALARNYDVPDLDENEWFWSGEHYREGGSPWTQIATDGGGLSDVALGAQFETVCVTTPSN